MEGEGRGRSALGRRLLLTGPQVAVVAVGRRRGALRAGLEVAEDASAEAMALLHRSWRSAGVRLGRSLCSWLGFLRQPLDMECAVNHHASRNRSIVPPF